MLRIITGHLRAFAKLRPLLPGFSKRPKSFFFTGSWKEMAKMGEYFSKVWKDLGLPGAQTLRDVRTAIAKWVRYFYQ